MNRGQDWEKHLLKLTAVIQKFRGERALVAAVLSLTPELRARIAFVAERRHEQAHVLAIADRQGLKEPYHSDHERTPCRGVLQGTIVSIPCQLAQQYPDEAGLETYLGVSLTDSQGQVVSVLALLGEIPVSDQRARQQVLEALSPRLAAELECVQLRHPTPTA